MPFSPDHSDMTRAVGALRSTHNPYGRQQPRDTSDLGDPPPAIFHRLMSAWKTGESVRAIHEDWRAQIESNGPFNARMRADALDGELIVDSEELLARADSEGGGVTARDAQSGQFASLGEAMRDAQATPLPGGMVPTEQAPPAPADPIRAAYWRAVDARAAQGNDS